MNFIETERKIILDLAGVLFGNTVFNKVQCIEIAGYYGENLLNAKENIIPFYNNGEWDIEEIESHFNKYGEGEEIVTGIYYKE